MGELTLATSKKFMGPPSIPPSTFLLSTLLIAWDHTYRTLPMSKRDTLEITGGDAQREDDVILAKRGNSAGFPESASGAGTGVSSPESALFDFRPASRREV